MFDILIEESHYHMLMIFANPAFKQAVYIGMIVQKTSSVTLSNIAHGGRCCWYGMYSLSFSYSLSIVLPILNMVKHCLHVWWCTVHNLLSEWTASALIFCPGFYVPQSGSSQQPHRSQAQSRVEIIKIKMNI